MLAENVTPGKVYLVWMSRKLRPVLIQRKVHIGWVGRVWPDGRQTVRIKRAASISQEYTAMPIHQVLAPMDYKSRAAGEREDEN